MELRRSLRVDLLQPSVEIRRRNLIRVVVVVFDVVRSTTLDRRRVVAVSVVVVFVDEDFPEQRLDVVVGAAAHDGNDLSLQEIVDDRQRLQSVKRGT